MAGNEIIVKVKATDEGLREDLKAKVEAAAAALGINVPVKVKLDEAGYLADLTKMYAAGMGLPDPKVGITADKDKAGKAGQDAGSSFLAGLGKSIDINPGAGTLNVPIAALPAALPIIGGLFSSLQALAGLLPLAAAGFVGLATAGVTAAIGLSGVTSTITAYTQAQEAAQGKTAQLAAQQLATSNSIISATQAVANARQAATDAARNQDNALISSREALDSAVQAQANAEFNADQQVEQATRAVQQAEQQLTSAKQAALVAEQNLTNARLAATRALEDAPNQVEDARIAQEQAIATLQQAQGAVTTAQQQQQATLRLTAQGLVSIPAPIVAPANTLALNASLDAARQRVVETGLAYQRAQEDAGNLTSKGVNGAQQVVSAQTQLNNAVLAQTNAIYTVQQAQEASARAQVTSAQQVSDAQQRVGDASRALTTTIITGNESVQRSQQAVDTALRAQAQTLAAAKASAEGAAGSLALYNAKLAELPPNAQDAVKAVTGLYDWWKNLQSLVQQKLFAGIGDDIRSIGTTVLPVVQVGLGKMADALNAVLQAFFGWLTSKDAVRDMGIIFDNVASAVRKLAPAIQPALQIVTDLVTVASSFLPGFADNASKSAQSLADIVRNARDNGQLKAWIQSGIDALKALWGIGKDLVGILDDIAGHKGPNASFLQDIATLVHDIRIGADVLGVLLQGLNKLTDWIMGTRPDFSHMFSSLWDGFKWVVNAIADAWNSLHFGLPSFDIFGFHTPSFNVTVPQLPHWMATGGVGSGLAIVGEQGPELVRLPQGSQVIPAGQSRQLMQDGGGNPIKVEVTIKADGTQFSAAVLSAVQYNVRVNGLAVLTQ